MDSMDIIFDNILQNLKDKTDYAIHLGALEIINYPNGTYKHLFNSIVIQTLFDKMLQFLNNNYKNDYVIKRKKYIDYIYNNKTTRKLYYPYKKNKTFTLLDKEIYDYMISNTGIDLRIKFFERKNDTYKDKIEYKLEKKIDHIKFKSSHFTWNFCISTKQNENVIKTEYSIYIKLKKFKNVSDLSLFKEHFTRMIYFIENEEKELNINFIRKIRLDKNI